MITNRRPDLSNLKKVTVEILGEEDLIRLLSEGQDSKHYIGFEISGMLHVGQAIATALVIRELQNLGVKTSIFLADWHTWINNKLNGDKELIKKVAFEYFIPSMRLALQIVGGNSEKLEFIFGSDLYHNNDRYWATLVEVCKNLTVSRVKKSTTILGRQESDDLKFAMLLYPPMQVADIFEMGCHIAHAGTDQRKCHVIAREVANLLTINPLKSNKGEIVKPIAIHHGLVSGLQAPAEWPLPEDINIEEFLTKYKMSKSIPNSAVFLQDSEEDIRNKIRKAFCPEKEVKYNPILNWIKNLIFPIQNKFELQRDDKYGGDKTYYTYEEIENDYKVGNIYPLDLKNNVASSLIEILEPIRDEFVKTEKKLLIEQIKESRSR
jgi:tyrosyl-tRNA synthetase